MEFHVLSTKKCHIEQTESNFQFIKDSLNQLRQDLHEAEIDFHRQPLDANPDEEEGKQTRFESSVMLLDNCQHPWTGEDSEEKTEVNKAAMSYYQRAQEKKDATNVDGPDLQRIKDKVVKHKEEAQVTFKKGLSSMWLVGSNPPELGPGFYNPEDHHAMRPFQPKKESSCFNSRQVTTDNKFMGGNHDSMRPRFCKTSTHVSEDAQPKRQKLPLWKSFNSIPDEQDGTCGVSLLNKSSFQTSDTTGPTSEDAAVLSFPNSYPNKPRSLELSIQSGVRFTKKRAPWETRLRPHMGGSGSCHNLGTSINRDRDKRDWDSKGFSFGKSKAR